MRSDVSNLILAINTLGDGLVGLELGVARGVSLMTILDYCNIKKLYGVDSWRPYTDYLKEEPDGEPVYFCDEKNSDFNKLLTYWQIKHSSQKDKVQIIEKDSMDAVKEIPDNSLDFIFFDAMMTEKQTYDEAKAYYPKIKKGGLFTGHDADCEKQVMEPIRKVKKEYQNNNRLVIFDKCFLFRV